MSKYIWGRGGGGGGGGFKTDTFVVIFRMYDVITILCKVLIYFFLLSVLVAILASPLQK